MNAKEGDCSGRTFRFFWFSGCVYNGYLDVRVPCFHPRREVANRTLAGGLLLRDDDVACGIVGETQRERGGGARAVPYRVQRLTQQCIKVNVLTFDDALLYLAVVAARTARAERRSTGQVVLLPRRQPIPIPPPVGAGSAMVARCFLPTCSLE